MEITFKYSHGGHDLGHIHIFFDPETNKATSASTFSGDICHFPREVTAWRPSETSGWIEADEPEKVWEHVKASGDKWKTTDKLPEGV